MVVGTIENCQNCKWHEPYSWVCCAEFLPNKQDIREIRKDKMARWAAEVHKHMEEMEGKDGILST